MDLIVSWIAFPLALLALVCGWGLLCDRLVGARLPGALVPGTGMAALIVLGGLAALVPALAGVVAPAAVALALTGFVLAGRARLGPIEPWAAACALAVFAVYAAPIVASGGATFGGYIRLDDTATWLAITDRIGERGVSVDGLAPSTYEATLAFNLGAGYPIGAFVPLAIGTAIVDTDPAWLIQPYMAVMAALLALAIWALAAPLVADRRLRAVAAFVAAQPALLYGYYLWGGVKEVVAAILIATAAGLIAVAVRDGFRARGLVPIAIVTAALVVTISPAGAFWLVPVLALIAFAGAREVGVASLLRAAIGPALLAAALIAPWLAHGVVPPTSAALTDGAARGVLFGPLDPAQLAGIWPAGDFRLAADARLLTALLVGLVVAAACVGAALAWRRRAWPLLGCAAAMLLGAGLMLVVGSPWVAGKALATASPALLLLALVAVAALISRGHRWVGAALALALAAGVLWSNALAYRDASLAPREQLAELEAIGERIAGRGPTLITEYQPYAARHFLRAAEPEAASELRRRTVALRGGGTLSQGESADTDRIDLGGLLAYRTLVLRRNPSHSRPPSAYTLDHRGDHYEVWQRRANASGTVIARLSLGDGVDPAAAPGCDRVAALAERAGPDGVLIAAPATTSVVAGIGPRGESVRRTIEVPRSGPYEIWLGGSVRAQAELFVDGQSVGTVRHQLNNDGQYVLLAASMLDRGEHDLEIRFSGSGLRPGGGGHQEAVGPLVLTAADQSPSELVSVDAARAPELCERRWDWIEAVGPADERSPPAERGVLSAIRGAAR